MKPRILVFKILGLVLFSLMTTAMVAQVTVTGRVVDAGDSSALIGVTVREKGTTNGTSTDTDGNFRLSVADLNVVLQFDYTGFFNR